MFAIIILRSTELLNTRSAVCATNAYDATTKPCNHAVAGAASLEHCIGSSGLVTNVEKELRRLETDPDPDRLRACVRAFERRHRIRGDANRMGGDSLAGLRGRTA